MKQRISKCETVAPRLLDTNELTSYIGMGRNKAVILGDEIGARVQIGKRVLWDKMKIDQYLNSLTGVK